MRRKKEHGPGEIEVLKLLKEVQPILAAALNSLGGQTPATPEAAYIGRITARTINRAAEGYLFLRESNRTDASKLLVRPAIEAVFYGDAVLAKRGMLFRKAYTEIEEDRTTFAKTPADHAKFDKYLDKLEKKFRACDMTYPTVRKQLKVIYAAEVAGMTAIYKNSYRVYCQYTHGAAGAVEGHWDDATDPRDTWIVTTSVLIILEMLVKYTPAKVPALRPFLGRLKNARP